MKYFIIDKNLKKTYESEEDLALQLSKEGHHIVYCDIECIAINGDDKYLLDECGNSIWLDPKRFELWEALCPVCKKKMKHVEYDETEGAEQIYCQKCGVWYNI